MKLHRLLFAALLPLASTAFVHAQAPRYVVIDLGALGDDFSHCNGINNAGEVAGYSYLTTGGYRAALFRAGSAPQNLGVLGGHLSTGFDINNAGEVAGWSGTPSRLRATLFRAGSAPQDLARKIHSAIRKSGPKV